MKYEKWPPTRTWFSNIPVDKLWINLAWPNYAKVAYNNYTNTQINSFTLVGSLFLCIAFPSSWDESPGLVKSAIFAGSEALRGCG